ncbi:extracellular solute-binding protein [Nonomuraea recticatena]|uniref:extracellular solute-binding protein n=1 Tax=Nonomuraea recticatena TaxID=46178 RepID=UPI00360B8DEC
MPQKVTAVLSAALLAITVAACGGGTEERSADAITVWTEENLADRMAVQQQIVADFTKKTGIKVNLVGVAEDQFSQIVTSAAAAGKLPDVIGALPSRRCASWRPTTCSTPRPLARSSTSSAETPSPPGRWSSTAPRASCWPSPATAGRS